MSEPPPNTLITVITVCLNEVGVIDRTLDSMLQQNRSNVEWIVFDGGSTDGTLEKLNNVKSDITILRSGADGGIYAAMNQAAKLASGRYLFFLNGGDTFLNSEVLSEFTAYGAKEDLITGDVEVIFPDGKTQYRPAADIEDLKNRLYWRSLPHISTFICRERFQEMNGYDLSFRICADWHFFLKAFQAGATFRRWSFPVGRFYFDGLSASPTSSVTIKDEKKRIRLEYPLSYRLRRDFNEWIGRHQHRLRQKRDRHDEV